MNALPVIAIFDVGKTNKKFFLFNEDYKIVYEKAARFTETTDEDGFPCENVHTLKKALFESLNEALKLKEFDIKAVNFSTYGASFVYVGGDGKTLTPLYNYLKPYPVELKEQFFKTYGGETALALSTASPVLESLNSGMQVYRLKYEQPDVFANTKYALHLPQYMSFLLTGKAFSDITSIGCHTSLWDLDKNDYHAWVYDEHIASKLAPIANADEMSHTKEKGKNLEVGIGLHDSSAALIPYLTNFHEPFMLLSTGTWCISLNPFNHSPLTAAELNEDCLCYFDYCGNPVKASRLFAGHEHDTQTKSIAAYFGQYPAKYKKTDYNPDTIDRLKQVPALITNGDLLAFDEVKLEDFKDDEEAYHHLVYDLVRKQIKSSNLVLNDTPVKRIFVDGGFSSNSVYMNMLAAGFPGLEVFAASMPQATALGAAIAIHQHWNSKPMPSSLIQLNYYSGTAGLQAKIN